MFMIQLKPNPTKKLRSRIEIFLQKFSTRKRAWHAYA